MKRLKVLLVACGVVLLLGAGAAFFVMGVGSCSDCKVLDKEGFKFVYDHDILEEEIEAIHSLLISRKPALLADFKLDAMRKVIVRVWSDREGYLAEQEASLGVRYPASLGYVWFTLFPSNREIRILNQGDGVAQTALHEFVHLVTLELNLNFANNPRWLWESIAVYKSEARWKYADKPYLIQQRFDGLASALNADANASGAIYEVGYTIGEYIESTWGKAAFITLVNSNGDIESLAGKPLAEVVLDWKAFVLDKYFDAK